MGVHMKAADQLAAFADPARAALPGDLDVSSDPRATTLAAKGRHDPCVLPRAVPMVEAMVALVLADHLLRQQGQCSLW
jgi:hypothetical protein